ncbi:MAG TPA: OadG-related small transporter subunit [Terriglobia bacterium]|nr:OadG-related small transporter subunit [Terriglobia bacterium]
MSENLAFGLTLTIVGMGGTMLSLWLLSLLTTALKKLFPVEPKKSTGAEK